MKIGVTIVLLLAVMALIVIAKKSSSKSKSSDAAKTAHKASYDAKKTSKTSSKTKKQSSKDGSSYTKTQKAAKSSRDEPEGTKPPRYQSKRQQKAQPERYAYEEEPVAATCEGPCSAETEWQHEYKQRKGGRQQYDCTSCRGAQEREETLPSPHDHQACADARSPAIRQEVRSAGSCPCAESRQGCQSCGQPRPEPCLEAPMAVPSCPCAVPQQPCPSAAPPCSPSQPQASCPWASASLPVPPPPQTQVPPQAYPTININTYSGAPVVQDAKPVNESADPTNSTDGPTGEEEVLEEDDEEEAVESEEEGTNQEGEEEEPEMPISNKYASCANPVLSEQMDDGYCYRTEL